MTDYQLRLGVFLSKRIYERCASPVSLQLSNEKKRARLCQQENPILLFQNMFK